MGFRFSVAVTIYNSIGIIFYDRSIPIQTLINITLLRNAMLTVPFGAWATCGYTHERNNIIVLLVFWPDAESMSIRAGEGVEGEGVSIVYSFDGEYEVTELFLLYLFVCNFTFFNLVTISILESDKIREKNLTAFTFPFSYSRTQCHMWVEFTVGSRLCSERFFSGYSGFPFSSKTNIAQY